MFIPFHANRSFTHWAFKGKTGANFSVCIQLLILVWTAKWKRTICAQHMHVVFISFVYWDLNPNRYASCPTADPSPTLCLWPCRAACLMSFGDVRLSKRKMKCFEERDAPASGRRKVAQSDFVNITKKMKLLSAQKVVKRWKCSQIMIQKKQLMEHLNFNA